MSDTEVRGYEFAWSLDDKGRYEVNVYRYRQHAAPVAVLTHDDWRHLRALVNALADIEASETDR